METTLWWKRAPEGNKKCTKLETKSGKIFSDDFLAFLQARKYARFTSSIQKWIKSETVYHERL